MRVDLTKSVVDGLACPEGKREVLVFDAKLPGFAVRVSAKGTKIFLVQYSRGRRSRRITLGRFGVITAAEARRKALELIGEVQGGADPLEERAEMRARAERERAEVERQREVKRREDEFTASVLIDAWVATKLKERSAAYRYEAPKAIRRLLGDVAASPAASISTADLQIIFDREVARAPVQAVGARSYGRACWNWGMKRGLVASNPFAGVVIEYRVKSRDRVLSDDEIQHVWRAAGAKDYPFGPLVQLLLLTLQRRSEVAGMRWSELSADFRTWTIPAARSKNRRAHIVHIPPAGVEILKTLRARHEGLRTQAVVMGLKKPDFDLVFTTTFATPVSGIEKAKRSLSKKSAGQDGGERRSPEGGEGGAKEVQLGEVVASDNWRLHDFRRTGVSKMAELGIPPHVADRVLNHVTGAIQGVAAVYQRFEFLPERQRALETWARYVLMVARGDRREANVIDVSFRKA